MVDARPKCECLARLIYDSLHTKSKKASSYIAQYLILRTVQSALHKTYFVLTKMCQLISMELSMYFETNHPTH